MLPTRICGSYGLAEYRIGIVITNEFCVTFSGKGISFVPG